MPLCGALNSPVRFYIIAGAERGNCVAVSQIVKTGGGNAGSRSQLFEMQIDSLSTEVPSKSICKDKVERIAPRKSCL